MAERLDLTVPVAPSGGYSSVWPQSLLLDLGEAPKDAVVRVLFRTDGVPERIACVLAEGAAARTMIANLDTADLRANSLRKRIMEHAVAGGHFAGGVSGAPD